MHIPFWRLPGNESNKAAITIANKEIPLHNVHTLTVGILHHVSTIYHSTVYVITSVQLTYQREGEGFMDDISPQGNLRSIQSTIHPLP